MSKNRREYLTLHLSYRHPLHFVKHLCPDQTGNLNVTPKYLSALSHESEVVFFISILCGAQDNLFLRGSAPAAGLQTLDRSLPDHSPHCMTHRVRTFTQGMKINCCCFQTSDYSTKNL